MDVVIVHPLKYLWKNKITDRQLSNQGSKIKKLDLPLILESILKKLLSKVSKIVFHQLVCARLVKL